MSSDSITKYEKTIIDFNAFSWGLNQELDMK